MIAYWMSNLVGIGQRVDSVHFGTFRDRILAQPLGRVASDLEFFNDAAGQSLFEITLEHIRVTEFPSRPSRLKALFLWPTIDLAREYHNGAQYAGIYEVVVQESRSQFFGDYNLVTYYTEPITLSGFLAKARQYWQNECLTGKIEILLDGIIEIQKEVTPSRLRGLVY